MVFFKNIFMDFLNDWVYKDNWILRSASAFDLCYVTWVEVYEEKLTLYKWLLRKEDIF